VQIWAAEQTMQSADWYQGTADAVRKQLGQILSTQAPYTLVLAGDHLYRMDYAAMAEFHWRHKADITVAVQPSSRQDASRFGILKRSADQRIIDFAEKPKDPALLSSLVSRDDPNLPYLASMGVYLFNTDVLIDLLTNNAFDDFGSHVIPAAISTHSVFGFDFEGYWVDIGTIRSFYETNLLLTVPEPPFNLFDPARPIYTHPRFLPGSRVENSQFIQVLIAEGCCVESATITHSIIGLRSQIANGTIIKDSILMGADYYDTPERMLPSGIPMGIGQGSHIEGAIIDKNVRIGAGVIIKPFPRGTDIDMDKWVVRDGIVVIPKHTVLQPGTHIEPGMEN
jgi:glucose-1-phosphate adenylyltransferase